MPLVCFWLIKPHYLPWPDSQTHIFSQSNVINKTYFAIVELVSFDLFLSKVTTNITLLYIINNLPSQKLWNILKYL